MATWSIDFFVFGPSELLLSETGYRKPELRNDLALNMHVVTPIYPFWSDGAKKSRFIYLPPRTKIDNAEPDRWNFPVGTRIWKDFSRHGVLVETRMLYKHGQSPWDWDMAAYLWRSDLSDADKLLFGRTNARSTPHDIPSPRECSSCHGAGRSRRPLGLTALQLPWRHESELSLSALSELGLLTTPVAVPYEIPGDNRTKSALGYMDTNCGTCRYEGSTYVDENIPLRLNLTTDTIARVFDTNA